MKAAPGQCVILVGGLGTRLGPLTAAAAKPLLQVGGRPFLDYLLSEAARFGFRKLLLLAGWRAGDVEAHLARSGLAAQLGLTIDVVSEPEPAGTGGALWGARHLLDEWFYLLNGDSWFDFNWLSLLTTPGAETAVATLALREIEAPGRYGVVETDRSLVRRFLEESSDAGPVAINAGVYLASRRIVAHLGPRCSLERDCFPGLAAAGELRALVCHGRFIDIGVPADFAAAQTLVPAWRIRPAAYLCRGVALGETDGDADAAGPIRWRPGAVEAIRRLNDAGFYVFVVDRAVGAAQTPALRAWMQAQLRPAAAHIDDVRDLASLRDEGVDVVGTPGRIDRWPLEAGRSVMLAAHPSEMEAGRAAGLRTILIGEDGLPAAVERALA